MTDTSDRSRQPAGVTVGGQFATEPKGEPAIALQPAGHERACRAHAVGCAVENLRDSVAMGYTEAGGRSPVTAGDDYLDEGTVTCICGQDTSWASSWIALGNEAIINAEGHEHGCRAHAVGCAVENLRGTDSADQSPVDVGDEYLDSGTATCLCGQDTSWAASWVELGETALRDQDKQWEGKPSFDDFSPAGRKAINEVFSHAYDWASARTGNLGMESSDYAEDYASWVSRRYMAAGLDDDSLGAHSRMVEEWDAERAANAALTLATTDRERHWISQMSSGRVLGADSLERTVAGRLVRKEVADLINKLGTRGIRIEETTATVGRGRGWAIRALDADRFGEHVATNP